MNKPMNKTAESLIKHLERVLKKRTVRTNGKADSLTIGVEHEFFLLDENNETVEMNASQDFLRCLAEYPGWKVQMIDRTNEQIERVSREHNGGRYTAVKYEYEPHLLEVAFAFHADLNSLAADINATFIALENCAKQTRCKIKCTSFLSKTAGANRYQPKTKKNKTLLYSREILFKKRNALTNKDLVNFTAITAATQTHIGGVHWWDNPQLINSLYHLEPKLLPLTALLATETTLAYKEVLRYRWQGYREVFQGFPLLGFPQMEHWTIQEWVSCLLNSPLIGGPQDFWTGESVNSLGESPFDDWTIFLNHVRDLQIIKPKLIGTLEFRGDPAQSGPKQIVAVAALRLASCLFAINTEQHDEELNVPRTEWWNQVDGNQRTFDTQFLDQLRSELLKRRRGEEEYLDVIYEHIQSENT